MRRIFSNSLFLLLTLFALSCKTTKTVTAPVVPAIPTSPPKATHKSISIERLNGIKTAAFNFNTFSAKANASLRLGNSSNDVNLNIRIKHGEKIWVSVTAIAGIEVARALITPDSVQVVNRIQNVYINKPFSFIYQFSNRSVTFDMLEALLLGNTLPGTPDLNDTYSDHSTQFIISGELPQIMYALTFNPANKLTSTFLQDKVSTQSITANYGRFGQIGAVQFPAQVSINTKAQNKSVQVNLEYSAVVVNQDLEFPFSVPRRFSIIR